MTQFITLSGTRYNVNHIVSYSADDRGGSYILLSVMTDENTAADRVAEPPKQIDELISLATGKPIQTFESSIPLSSKPLKRNIMGNGF